MADFEIQKPEVLDEFDIEDMHFQIIRPRPGDISKTELRALAENLADTNFEPLPIYGASVRASIRGRLMAARSKLGNMFGTGRILDDIAQAVYPDYSHNEHTNIYAEHAYPNLIAEGNVLAVIMDGKTVAIQACRKMGDTESGREIYEFTKASTLNDERLRRKGLNARMKKMMYAETMQRSPGALWASASRNQKHLERFERRGWHVVEMDDPHEAVQAMYRKNPEYSDLMKQQGYKAMYLDPKIDHPTWDER